MNNFGNRST